MNRYPDYELLTGKLARYCQVSEDQVVLTGGSDQAIDLVFRTFVAAGDTVVIPSPGFAMTTQAARLASARLVEPQFTAPDFSYPFGEVMSGLDPAPRLIVVCNPNSPTGTLITPQAIKAIATASATTVILVDEAYYEFAGVTAVGLIDEHPNIVVTRTFSKAFGLAGLRVGYIIASSEHARELNKVCGPYSLGVTAHAAACAALDDLTETREYADEVMNRAMPHIEEYFSLSGIRWWQSAANFLLFEPDQPAAIAQALQRRGVWVRRHEHIGDRGALRVTVGTLEEAIRFVKIYDDILRNHHD